MTAEDLQELKAAGAKIETYLKSRGLPASEAAGPLAAILLANGIPDDGKPEPATSGPKSTPATSTD